MVWMKKTLNIDAELLAEARRICGAATDTQTIREGLLALVRRAALERLASYREPGARDTPRRREEPARHGRARRASAQ